LERERNGPAPNNKEEATQRRLMSDEGGSNAEG